MQNHWGTCAFFHTYPNECCAKLEIVEQLARVSERNLKARETGDITIAKWCSGVSRETTRFSVKSH